MTTAPTALILGATGQDGAYLAHFLLAKRYRVHGTTRALETANRDGLRRLGVESRVPLHQLHTTDLEMVSALLKSVAPDEIYNLAGQSSVGLSFELPLETFDSIALATMTLLEAVRRLGLGARIFNAGSSECYGECDTPAAETAPADPRSPYAVARTAARHAVSNYRDVYGLYACTGILSNHESPFRPARFVTRKIIQTALRIADGSGDALTLGNVEILRDWGWAADYVQAYWSMLQADAPADCNIATGQTSSLADFVRICFEELGLDWRKHVVFDNSLLRPSEFRATRVDPGLAAKRLGWRAQHRMPEVVRLLLQCERDGSPGPLPWERSALSGLPRP